MTSATKTPYAGHRFPPELISYTVWLYYRFPLSLRMVEEMLALRSIEVSHETIRQWGLKFGQEFANLVRRRLPRPGDKWHLGDPAGGRAPPAPGPQQPGGELAPADPPTRTPDEALQVGPTRSTVPLRPRSDQQPLPPAPPPHACNRLPRRPGPGLQGVA